LLAHVFELGEQEFRLLLDSGSDTLLVFTRLGPNSKPQDSATLSALGANNWQAYDTLAIRGLKVGKSSIRAATVVAPVVLPQSDVDGLLPTSLFSSIFISHSGEFVILNPSLPKASR
jgi:hypothetical protein